MSWSARAESAISRPFVKFANVEEKILKFLSEPEDRKFVHRGKEITSFEFKVEVNSVEKTWGITSKKLMEKLIAEDRREPIIGRFFRIKAKGGGVFREYEVQSVDGVN